MADRPPGARTRPLTDRELAVMNRIESRLVTKGETWASLARKVGKTNSSGSQWSGKRSFPREQTLYKIAQALEVGMGWLLAGDEPGEQTRAQTDLELAALQLMREMSPAEQLTMLAAGRGIKGSLTKK